MPAQISRFLPPATNAPLSPPLRLATACSGFRFGAAAGHLSKTCMRHTRETRERSAAQRQNAKTKYISLAPFLSGLSACPQVADESSDFQVADFVETMLQEQVRGYHTDSSRAHTHGRGCDRHL